MKNLENVKKMMLQCVVINWDGTLVSSAAMIHQAYLKTMQALQIHPEWSPEDTMRQNGRPPVEIFNDAGIWGSKAIGSVAKDFFYRGLEDIRKTKPELLRLKDGALDLLNWFDNTRPSRALSSAATKPNPFWSWKSRHSNLKVW